MHAYLLVAGGKKDKIDQINLLAKKYRASILKFPLSKIDDVRYLNHLISCSFSSPTIFVLDNFNEATEEAQNALLKNLEEPQENVYFVLTSPATGNILPTILSRCQIIRTGDNDDYQDINDESEKFLNSSIENKLNVVDKIRDRNVAIDFTERLIKYLHGNIHTKKVKYELLANQIEIIQKTLTCLKANGNVNLHLSKMAIDLDN